MTAGNTPIYSWRVTFFVPRVGLVNRAVRAASPVAARELAAAGHQCVAVRRINNDGSIAY